MDENKVSGERKMSRKGFTLIELMIVIAIIAIIAAIAIPSLLRSQMSSNETAAIGTLRTLVASQAQFKGASAVDQDNDGTGEYGYFQELTGTAATRITGTQVPYNVRAGEYITQVLGNVAVNGAAAKSGYHFYIYLPDNAAGTVGESVPLPAGNAAFANDQETRFMCYAWPVTFNSSGKRCFVVNQQGEVYQARNDNAGVPFYNGQNQGPNADAAILSTWPNSTDITGPFPASQNAEVGVDTQ
jgi:prepilin-type N-terminal cleavage/methylation domain-containing protein